MSGNKFGINVVSKKTGLTSHAIRAWEKRYSAVVPIRTQTNRRLYKEDHIQRLKNLKTLTDSGYNIGQIANLPDYELTKLVSELQTEAEKNNTVKFDDTDEIQNKYLEQAINSIINYNANDLENIISTALVEFGNIGLINKLLVPLMEKIGELWREGKVRIAQEHLASQTVRSFLGNLLSNKSTASNAPNIIVTTPFGQIHELGAILAASTAATEGWDVSYMGPNLPSEEIVGAALANNSKAVALSIIYPKNDSTVLDEIKNLRKLLPENVEIIIGGRSSDRYKSFLNEDNIKFIESLDDFRNELEKITEKATPGQPQ
ncbi:MAG: MerR family transcriptional regulator [Candidatus Dadabacteria bacterium]|nr:MerR family transcriptional regulator [Candidatus Dadabacteria bacterium]NIY22888.1 MerR family transcriptional regulator [Candidatus Dadabacteria bacterium]